MAVEIVLLHVERREVPVAIESRLADRHDAGLVEHGDDPVPIARLRVGQVVGLHAHGGVNALVFGGQFDADRARVGRDADRDDVLDAGLARPRDDIGPVVVELRLIEVGVRVEELHSIAEHGSCSPRSLSPL